MASCDPEHAFDSDTPSRTVPCRQCGTSTKMCGGAVDVWAICNRALQRAGKPKLGDDEVTVCGRDECRQADSNDKRSRNEPDPQKRMRWEDQGDD